MYVYICMCMCMYLCMYVRMYVCTYASRHTHTYIHTYIHTCIYTYIHGFGLKVRLPVFISIYIILYLIKHSTYSTVILKTSKKWGKQQKQKHHSIQLAAIDLKSTARQTSVKKGANVTDKCYNLNGGAGTLGVMGR